MDESNEDNQSFGQSLSFRGATDGVMAAAASSSE